jgi:hypothetical protein
MKFHAGTTYTTRSIGDANCIIAAKVISRTAKTVKVEFDNAIGDRTQSFRIKEYNGIEFFKPWGNYSMSPVMTAEV